MQTNRPGSLPAPKVLREPEDEQREASPPEDKRMKLGLALSGGGFRASLFHIGVLARMAELDLLKQVAVLSTVSGGSIVGAHYYLKVKQLLEGRRRDGLRPACRDAYVQIVREIEQDFLAGVQENIRMRTFLNPFKNVKILREDYSRSDHIAELYRRYFYQRVWADAKEPQQRDAILLQDIKITPSPDLMPPALQDRCFTLAEYNTHADFKIPVLTINATTLNTGHPWEFTSSWVGESTVRNATVRRIDSHRVLERLRFDGGIDPAAPSIPLTDEQLRQRAAKLQELTLADAVAASACVPGIFDPLAIHHLYWNSRGEEIVVQLVDGGVYDNQGLEALFAANCTHIICSDASGQMEDVLNPSTQFYNVLKRSNDILMDRVREDGLQDLFLRERGEKALTQLKSIDPTLRQQLADRLNIREFAFFHLKDSFAPTPDYPNIPGPADTAGGMIYQLSKLRTDLDSFTDLEAYTLMYDGYCLSGEEIGKQNDISSTTQTDGQTRQVWRFLAIRGVLLTARQRLHKHLRVGTNTAFKVFLLGEPLAYVAALPIIGALAYLVWRFWDARLPIPIPISVKGMVIAGLIALASLNKTVKKAMKTFRVLRKLKHGIGVAAAPSLILPAVAALGSVVVWVHLKVFDRIFLRSGRI